ncbi:MAG: hypothetical protein ACWA44_02625 [Thiotrichales bacterium]
MSDKSFLQSKWKPFEIVTVYAPTLNRFVECIIVGIDFEDRTFNVRPLDVSMYEDEMITLHMSVINRGGAPKLRVVENKFSNTK